MGPDSITWTGVRPSRDLASGPAHPHGTRVSLTLPPDAITVPDATLDAKLANFDRHVRDAVYDLIDLLFQDQDRLIRLARERHIWGHHEYGDANLREWDDARLRVERDQEIADWLVYRCDEYRRGSTA